MNKSSFNLDYMSAFDNLEINRIIRGNCLEILPQIPDKSVDLVITDPPFNVMNKTDLKFKHRADITQQVSFDEFESYQTYLSFTEKWVRTVAAKMKQDSSLYVFFAVQFITDLMRICLSFDMKYKGVLVWHKSNPAPKIRKSGYVSSTEAILFMVKGKPPFHFLGQNKMHNFITTPICMGEERLRLELSDQNAESGGKITQTLHPTQKPMALYEHFISVSSNEGDLVCDPFAGTGTANAACRKLKRYCIGIEKNEEYIGFAQKRLSRIKEQIPRSRLDDWI
jgi:site-specific DNA-methyltransferase (adenine-specific)/modification methylase